MLPGAGSGRGRESAPDQSEYALARSFQPPAAGEGMVSGQGVGEDMFDIVILAIQSLNFVRTDIERGAFDLRVIVQGNKQNPGVIGNYGGQVPDIVLAHMRGQGDQGGAVVHQAHVS